jgi:hypothetical protein
VYRTRMTTPAAAAAAERAEGKELPA